jgi:hypothetical protein
MRKAMVLGAAALLAFVVPASAQRGAAGPVPGTGAAVMGGARGGAMMGGAARAGPAMGGFRRGGPVRNWRGGAWQQRWAGWRNRGGWHHRGGWHRRNYGYPFWGGLAAGAIIGGTLAYPYDGAYVEGPAMDPAVADCARRYRTYDIRTQTYFIRPGVRAHCP